MDCKPVAKLTGTQGEPPAFNGLAGPGTLVRYGEDPACSVSFPLVAEQRCTTDATQRDAAPDDVAWLAELNARATLTEQRLADLKAMLDEMRRPDPPTEPPNLVKHQLMRCSGK